MILGICESLSYLQTAFINLILHWLILESHLNHADPRLFFSFSATEIKFNVLKQIFPVTGIMLCSQLTLPINSVFYILKRVIIVPEYSICAILIFFQNSVSDKKSSSAYFFGQELCPRPH